MENVSKLISSIGALLWPLMAIILIFILRDPIKSVFGSLTKGIENRDVKTIEYGNFKMSFEESAKRQQEQIKKLSVGSTGTEEKTEEFASVLWVDDVPMNNYVLIDFLEGKDIQVTTAISTENAMQLFKKNKYDRIISDMGRQERYNYNEIAGIELIRKVRQLDADIPIFIFCSYEGVAKYSKKAMEAGATYVTNNGTDLLKELKLSG